ncbi:hypothetical protein C823_007772 [Eubacterium plexicaudatum ASF492]|uniref:Uncharacterized protein n=1 Tax=Eubacterium plexicaudatum ASF492 TaxID=1235802 RepID=N2A9W9_9FIRM|nr:hypothetical protein C823_007772 [Eubacterium plexicaudatum ASF492]
MIDVEKKQILVVLLIIYTINIFAHDINPTNDGRVYADTAVQNVHENMSKIFGKERHYCRKCKEKIEKYMSEVDE